MSNGTEIYIELLHLLSESHRMLLGLAKLDPSECNMEDRNEAYRQASEVQAAIDKVTGKEEE